MLLFFFLGGLMYIARFRFLKALGELIFDFPSRRADKSLQGQARFP